MSYRKLLLFLAVPFLSLSIVLAIAGNGNPVEDSAVPGNPFAYLQEQINDIQDQLAELQLSALPEGVIVMWSGSLASIPDGWALCDGNNGTPDLREKFIMGSPDGFDPGATGGTVQHEHMGLSHDHLLPSLSHNHGANPPVTGTTISGAHIHLVGTPTSIETDVVTSFLGGIAVASSTHTHTGFSAGNHTHTFDISIFDTGSALLEAYRTSSEQPDTQMSDHLPPYYEAAFIMKLAESP